MIQNLLGSGLNKYYDIAFPCCTASLLGKNKKSYFLKLDLFIYVYVKWGRGSLSAMVQVWRSEENPGESVLLHPMSSGF